MRVSSATLPEYATNFTQISPDLLPSFLATGESKKKPGWTSHPGFRCPIRDLSPPYNLSVTTVEVAPSGCLVMTGSDPPDNSDFTVRS